MRHEVERKTRRSLGHWVLHNRFAIQVASIIFANSYLLRHWKGFCYPVLNCWACPGASFACPIGVLQNASSNASYTLAETGIRGLWVALPLYTIGTLLLFSALFGRMMCGWLCPFGWFQEMVGRLRRKKSLVPAPLTYLRFAVLAGLVFVIPYYTHQPWFSKLCPMGALEGGLLQPLFNPELRSMMQEWWWFKQILLVGTIATMLFWKRPFCAVICPLGAIFSLFQRVSAWEIRFAEERCVNCLWCVRHCPQGIDPRTDVNGRRCIGCLECQKCPFGAITSVPRWAPKSCSACSQNAKTEGSWPASN